MGTVYKVRPIGEVLKVSPTRRRGGLVFDRHGTLVSTADAPGVVQVKEDALQEILEDKLLQCRPVELPNPEKSEPSKTETKELKKESEPDPEWLELAAIYEEKEGKKPSSQMKLENLRKKVNSYGDVADA